MFGRDNWGLLFFINVPICIIILLMLFKIKVVENKRTDRKMDTIGSVIV